MSTAQWIGLIAMIVSFSVVLFIRITAPCRWCSRWGWRWRMVKRKRALDSFTYTINHWHPHCDDLVQLDAHVLSDTLKDGLPSGYGGQDNRALLRLMGHTRKLLSIRAAGTKQ